MPTVVPLSVRMPFFVNKLLPVIINDCKMRISTRRESGELVNMSGMHLLAVLFQWTRDLMDASASSDIVDRISHSIGLRSLRGAVVGLHIHITHV